MFRLSARLGLPLAAALLVVAGPGAVAPAAAADGLGYIVVLEDSVADPAAVAAEQAQELGLEVGHVYEHALQGYSAVVPAGFADSALGALAADERVAYVELDGGRARRRRRRPARRGVSTASTSAALPLSGHVHLHRDRRGRDGLRHRHRHPLRPHAVRRARDHAATTRSTAAPADDCHGHGTHVAGTIGGSTYGVAKGVRSSASACSTARAAGRRRA